MKAKKWLPLLLAALMTFSVIGLAACGDTGETPPPDDDKPTVETGVPTEPVVLPTQRERTTNVAVHDPSIFHDPAPKGVYYVFGSHFAVAKSVNLIQWEQVARDNQDTVLFEGGVRNAMPKTLQLAKGNTDAWAPDVEYYNGKYYMYISFTTAMYTDTSVISRVEADSPTGPYSNEVILLESISDEAAKSGNDKPNCIDPELFYDKDGKLWMVYGSFFGGIYIKELYNEGEKWGLPKEEGVNNWGKRIWLNGNSTGVEGPYVFYNSVTDYYYLMTSEDDLMTKYNMRVARSKNPDGPYVDITGNDVATAQGKGNKIAGNYRFARQTDAGYGALGHNSVIKDKDGRYFVVYHARRQEGLTGNSVTLGHNLYVSQLYFNEDGWPVMSPNAYVGEKSGTVTEAQVAADYEIVIHSANNSQDFIASEDYTLKADGKISKGSAEVGTWELKQSYYVTLTINDVIYKGVVVPGFDMYTKTGAKGILTITAVSNAGVPLWALAK